MSIIKKIRRIGLKKSFESLLWKLKYYLILNPLSHSYSQFGEDILIDKYVGKKKGFYVDVGANDPSFMNNTKRFYDKGWRGITIDPNLSKWKKLEAERPEDINLNICLGNKIGEKTLYIFGSDTVNTLSKEEKEFNIREGFEFLGEKKVKVETLESVLDKYLQGRNFDLLSIDTEGNDLEVLQGNNWKKYRPKVICIEIYTAGNTTNKKRDSETKYLVKLGYKKVAETEVNAIWLLNKQMLV